MILNISFVAELHQILSRDRHPSYSAEFYSSYVNILLGVFYSVCRDLRELRHLVRILTRSTPPCRPHLTNDFFPLFSRRRSTSQSSVSRCQKDEVNYKAGAFVHLTADQILKRPSPPPPCQTSSENQSRVFKPRRGVLATTLTADVSRFEP